MTKKFTFFMVGVFTMGILAVSCRSAEHPSQMGNREKLDRYHQRKQVR